MTRPIKYMVICDGEPGKPFVTRRFDTREALLAAFAPHPSGRGGHEGLREELRGQPVLAGFAGPMWGGILGGAAWVRYEDPKVCELLSR